MNAPARSIVFQEIASAIGRESARKLIDALGGQRIYVPETIDENHEIAHAIGIGGARQLSRYFPHARLNLPVSGKRRETVKELDKRGGLSRRKIAGETGYSERQIYRILGEGVDDRQGDMFGDEPS